MKGTVRLAMSTIRIMALHALVKECQYRVLKRQRHYCLSGAICGLVNKAAKTDHSIMLAPNCQAVQLACQQIRKLEVVTDEALLLVAREWESLPREVTEDPLVMTAAFASLMHKVNTAVATVRRTKQNKSRKGILDQQLPLLA